MLMSRTQLPQALGQGVFRRRRRLGLAARQAVDAVEERRRLKGHRSRVGLVGRAAARARSACGSRRGSAIGRWWSCRPPAAAPRGTASSGNGAIATPTRSSSIICSARSMRRPMPRKRQPWPRVGFSASRPANADSMITTSSSAAAPPGSAGRDWRAASADSVRSTAAAARARCRATAAPSLPSSDAARAAGCRRCSRCGGCRTPCRRRCAAGSTTGAPRWPRRDSGGSRSRPRRKCSAVSTDACRPWCASPDSAGSSTRNEPRGGLEPLRIAPEPEQVVGHPARQLGGVR